MEVCNYSTKWKDIWELPLIKFDYIDFIQSSNVVLALSYFRDDWASNTTMINKIISIIDTEIHTDFLTV